MGEVKVRKAERRTGASRQMSERGHLWGQIGSRQSEQSPGSAQAGMGEGGLWRHKAWGGCVRIRGAALPVGCPPQHEGPLCQHMMSVCCQESLGDLSQEYWCHSVPHQAVMRLSASCLCPCFHPYNTSSLCTYPPILFSTPTPAPTPRDN